MPTHLVAVGACAIDNILSVPYFPAEDSKLRASSFTKRRGGNCPNSLEVLVQLINQFSSKDSEEEDTTSIVPPIKLSLIASLPSHSSLQIPFVASSFGSEADTDTSDGTASTLQRATVDLSRCIYREEFTEPVSSYIICSQATSSRTIVNHNELPEMTLAEFVETTAYILQPESLPGDQIPKKSDDFWFHFEGRIPETTLECIRHLRRHAARHKSFKLHISVELEKPKREGLQNLALEADVVFHSRSWAEAEGYTSAEVCLKEQAKLLIEHGSEVSRQRTLVCTWSDRGACALLLPVHDGESLTEQDGLKVVQCPAYIDRGRPVIDTVGAGDTFIAGILFASICRGRDSEVSGQALAMESESGRQRQPVWSVEQRLTFANELAGRKVLQHGFQGLSTQLQDLVKNLDRGKDY